MKFGRPPSSLTAWRTLHAREELEARFPAVVRLLDMLALQNVDPEHVRAAIAEALANVTAGLNRTREDLPDKASAAERQLHAAAEVERLAQDRETLAALNISVDAALKTTALELAKAETHLCQVMLEREPVNLYERAFVEKLRAAGLTDKHARTTSPEQILRIQEIFSSDVSVSPTQSPRPSRKRVEVALAWRPNNAWCNLSRNPRHYRLLERDITKRDMPLFRQCGLPPFADLAQFGYPELFGAFEATKMPRDMAKACWRICRKWVGDHIVDDIESQNVSKMREWAWSFLFGVKYGFAHEVGTLKSGQLPSPWNSDKYVWAERRE